MTNWVTLKAIANEAMAIVIFSVLPRAKLMAGPIMTAIIFPWLDYANGIVMLKGHTKIMVRSQTANALTVMTILLIMIFLSPGWNGMIGALAFSLGFFAELFVVIYNLRMHDRNII